MQKHIPNVLEFSTRYQETRDAMAVVQKDKLQRMRKKLLERYTRQLSLISVTQLYVTEEINFAWIVAPLEKLSEADSHKRKILHTI